MRETEFRVLCGGRERDDKVVNAICVSRVADALVDGGARVERHTPLLPDLTEAATLYMRLLMSGSVARFPIESDEQLRTRVAGLSADDRSLDAVRLRAMVSSHRDWIEANNPTQAFPHDHDPNPLERRIDIPLRLAELLERKTGGFQAPK